MSSMSAVQIVHHGSIALVEFERPPHNHITVQLARELADAFDAVDANPELRCSVLASGGKSFCAGADFNAPRSEDSLAQEGVEALYEQAVRMFAVRKPIVAALQGAAIGAGLGLALVADFRVAAPEARLAANFVKLGFHPGFGITHTLPRLIGPQRASLMCLTGRRIKAEEALGFGLIDQIAPIEELRTAALQLAAEIGENAPLAVQATRATLRAELAAQVQAQTAKEFVQQAMLRKTADFAEGVRAVQERRPGRFIGA